MPGRARTWTLRGVLAVLVVLLVWSAGVLVAVRADLVSARADLEQARAAPEPAAALAPLAAAEASLQRASSRLAQPGPRALAAVPLAGRALRAVRVTASAALAVTSGARDVLHAAEGSSGWLADGRVDLERLEAVRVAVETAAEDTAGPVAALREQSLVLVPGAVAGPAREAAQELAQVPAELERAAAALRGLHGVLGGDGPQELLVLLENNAELRATGGIVTVFAEATVVDGRLQVRGFQDVDDVADPPDRVRRVAAPADFVALYGDYLADTTLWKNTNMSPDVPTSSAVMAEVAAAATGRRPDAVLWLDVPTFAAVLRATGPVALPDGTLLQAEDVVPRLLSQAYREADDSTEGQTQRRAELRAAADAVIGSLLGLTGAAPGAGPVSAAAATEAAPADLARELLGAARGRHLALWSADPATQADLARAGLDGAVLAADGDVSAVTVHNLGGGDADGNKLDFYGRRQSSVRVRLHRDVAEVEQEIALRNTAPASGLPVYVAGRVTPGVNNALVHLSLPPQAQQVELVRDDRLLDVAPRPEGDRAVLTDVVAVPPGATTTWRLTYRLPLTRGHYALAMFPQPLAVDSGVLLEVAADDGLQLVAAAGTELVDGRVQVSGPFTEVLRVEVEAQRPDRLHRWRDAVRRFWNEPVRLPR